MGPYPDVRSQILPLQMLPKERRYSLSYMFDTGIG